MVTMETKLNTVEEISAALVDLAYSSRIEEDAILTGITVNSRSFPMVLTIGGPNQDELVFDVQVCHVSDAITGETEIDKIQAISQLLAANKEFRPFAVTLLDTADGIDPSDLVVLTDSIKIGDLSAGELDSQMNAARRALNLLIAILGISTE